MPHEMPDAFAVPASSLRGLTAFGELPPSARRGAAAVRARATICSLFSALAANRTRLRGLRVLEGAEATALARRGVYALISSIARDAEGSREWRVGDTGDADFVYRGLGVLAVVSFGCSDMCGRRPCLGKKEVPTESFRACHEALLVMMQSPSLAASKLVEVLGVVTTMARKLEPDAVVNCANFSRVFGGAAVDCVLRCAESVELRDCFHWAVSLLGEFFDGANAAISLGDVVLGSCQYKQVLALVERKLQTFSLRAPCTIWFIDSVDQVDPQAVADAELSKAMSAFVCQVRSCPRASVVASSVCSVSQHALLALILRQPFLDSATVGSDFLVSKLIDLASRGDVADWKNYVRVAFLDGGIFAAVLNLLGKPCGVERWAFGSAIITEFKRVSEQFFASHGLPEQLRLGEDRTLLKALVRNINTVSSRLKADVAALKVQFDDLRLIDRHADALSSISGNNLSNLASRLAIGKVGGTLPALRALASLNLVRPGHVVGMRNRTAGSEPPPVSQCILQARFSLLNLIRSMVCVSGERSKFVNFPEGLQAIVTSMFTAWPIASLPPSMRSAERFTAVGVVNLGLRALTEMSSPDSDKALAILVLSVKHGGRDVLALSTSVLTAAPPGWDDICPGPPGTTVTSDDSLPAAAATLVYNLCFPRDGPQSSSPKFTLNRDCARDETLVKGLLKGVSVGCALGSAITTVACFGLFAMSLNSTCQLARDEDGIAVALMWHRVGAFSAVLSAAMKMENLVSVESALEVALLAYHLTSTRENACVAPFQAIVDDGILLRLLEMPLTETSNNSSVRKLKRALRIPTDSAAVPIVSPTASSEVMSPTTLPVRLLADGQGGSTVFCEGSGSDGAQLSGREAALYDAQHGHPTQRRRRWPCSNRICVSVCSDSVPMMTCSICRMPHYCSKACQKLDWKIHKLTCTDSNASPSVQ